MAEDNIYFDKQKTKGRPRLILNEHGKKLIENLSSIMCTDEEIASALGVVIETLNAKHNRDAFLALKKKGNDTGRSSLRKWQFESAKKGNVSMQIWLGKQYLDQKEQISNDVKADNAINIKIDVPTESEVNNE